MYLYAFLFIILLLYLSNFNILKFDAIGFNLKNIKDFD